jgi:hypothetical protein
MKIIIEITYDTAEKLIGDANFIHRFLTSMGNNPQVLNFYNHGDTITSKERVEIKSNKKS